MDFVEVLSNLHALRQLYELLQNIEDDDLQRINSKNVQQTLDPRARKIFKQLLDDATEKMFHTHLKIIELQSVEKTTCPSRQEQPKAMPKLQAPVSADAVNSSLNQVLGNEKNSKSSKIISNNDDQYPVKCQSGISWSKVSTSSDVPQYKKKRCHACLAKGMRKQYSTKDATVSNERVDPQRDCSGDSVSGVDVQAKRLQESNRNATEGENPIDETLPSSVSLTTGADKQETGFTPIGEMKKKLDEGNDFAKVVTNAISQIESCILALKWSSNWAHSSTSNDVDEHVPFKLSISVSPVEQSKEDGIITRQAMKQTEMGESSLGKGTQLTPVSQKHGEFAQSVPRGQGSPLENHMKRFESLSPSASEKNNEMESYINLVRVSPSPNEVTLKPPMQLKTPDTPVQTSETSLVQNRTARKRTLRYNSSMPPQSMGSMVSSVGGRLGERLSQTRRLKTEKRHDQQMMRPVFLDDDDDMPSRTRRSHKMSYVGSGRKLMPRQEESEEENSSSSSRSTSTWTSKQNESCGSSCSNYSEESWSSRYDDFSESECNSQESASSSYPPSFEEDRSRLTDSVERDYSHKRYPDKSIGRLRKIKNRLGLIFHHHHHHHHHHHGNDRSMWKRVQKMFYHKDKHGRNDHGKAEGFKKSLAVKNMSNKNQGGHFHALVKGLMRRAKHSKKSKGGIRPHGLSKKKVVNKLHWWQTVRGGGGVKLPKRGRVKVGFANKRPKLPMKR